jgi:glycosyltransferase involved in cell wall biosynthesis
MKLAICIPAFNEEQTIGEVIAAVPNRMTGITGVKIFVADDGSADETAQTARQAGEASGHDVEVLPLPHKGLAGVFLAGIQAALDWGADVIVNIDADGQYRAEEIPLLIAPLLRGEADMVIGDRQVESLEFMPAAKKYGNLAGSWFLRRLTGSQVKDASSGFRAYSRKAAESIEVHSQHTYTHENLIQAHYQGLRIAQVPVTFVARTDGTSSRLIRGVLKHILKSLQGIFAARRRWRR